MSRERDDQMVLELDHEAVFGDGAPFAGAELKGRVWGCKLDSLNSEVHEDKAYKITGGEHQAIKGLCAAAEKPFSFSCNGEGLGTAAGDAVPAAPTWFTHLIDGCCQIAGDVTTGSKAEVGATAVHIVEDVPGAHQPAAVGDIGLAGFAVTGQPGIHVRPFTYTGPDEIDLLMALPAAPALNDVIYGAVQWPWVRHWAAGLPVSYGMRFKGNSQHQHKGAKGCAGVFKIGETGPKDVPQFDFSWQASDYVDLATTAAWIRTGPPLTVANVNSGSGCLIGAYGTAAAPTAFHVIRAAFDVGPEYSPDYSFASTSGDGFDNYSRKAGMPTLKVTVPMTATPVAALTSNFYRDFERDGQVLGNEIHVLLTLGVTMGRRIAIYLPRAIVRKWAPKSDGGLDLQEFTISPCDANIDPATGLVLAPHFVMACM